MLHCEVGWRETCFFLSNSGPRGPAAVYIGTGQGIIAFRGASLMWCLLSKCRTVPEEERSVWSDKAPLALAALLERPWKMTQKRRGGGTVLLSGWHLCFQTHRIQMRWKLSLATLAQLNCWNWKKGRMIYVLLAQGLGGRNTSTLNNVWGAWASWYRS